MSETFDPKKIHKKENPTPEGKGRRQLAYVNEFKEFIRANPGIINNVLELAQEIDVVCKNDPRYKEAYSPEEDQTITTERNGITVTRLSIKKPVYKVRVGNETYAVKINPWKGRHFGETSLAAIRTAYSEFAAAQAALEIVRSFPDVEVMEFQLGYKSNDNDIFVSKWVDNLEHVPSEHRDRALNIYSTLSSRGFYDTEIWYDGVRNKFVVIDTGNYLEDVENKYNKKQKTSDAIEDRAEREKFYRNLDGEKDK